MRLPPLAALFYFRGTGNPTPTPESLNSLDTLVCVLTRHAIDAPAANVACSCRRHRHVSADAQGSPARGVAGHRCKGHMPAATRPWGHSLAPLKPPPCPPPRSGHGHSGHARAQRSPVTATRWPCARGTPTAPPGPPRPPPPFRPGAVPPRTRLRSPPGQGLQRRLGGPGTRRSEHRP